MVLKSALFIQNCLLDVNVSWPYKKTAEEGKQVLHLSQPLPGAQWQKDPTPYA